MAGSMDFTEDRFREIVERCLRLVLSAGASLPAEDEDWVASGALDSMGHVDALLCIEKASSLPDLFARLEGDPPRTTQSVLAALRKLVSEHELAAPAQALTSQPGLVAPVGIAGWGFGLGSRCITAAAVEEAFGLSPGTIADRAGIEDRKSTRLNSSHLVISYAVFCLKKKKNKKLTYTTHNRT